MRLFTCPTCQSTLFFSSVECTACGTEVTFDPAQPGHQPAVQPCANREAIACPWIAEEPGGLCACCATTEVVPDTLHGDNQAHWAAVEHAKRWVHGTLARWGWFLPTDPGPRPRYHLLAEETRHGEESVVMGHAGGLVTLNVTEADPTERVARREALEEPLRTLIGHVRHELAHMLWERLVAEHPSFQEGFRSLFGDESQDYAAALSRHYSDPPTAWVDTHISAYATAHPHEDWAETAAHLLHLTDILDSAQACGLTGAGDAYAQSDPQRLISEAVDLGIALNHVNRSMGLTDLYPFVLSEGVRTKLAFAHRWLSGDPALSGGG